MKTQTFYILDYNKDPINVKYKWSLHSSQKQHQLESISSIFDHIIKRKKRICTYVYTYDLAKIYALSLDDPTMCYYRIKPFSHKNVYYCLEITNICNPSKKLIIKDLYNFFSPEILSNNLDKDYNNMVLLYSELSQTYGIGLNKKYILSTASLAMRIFKKKYLENNKIIPQLSKNQDGYIRKAYFGGRNEIIIPCADNNYYYDVNSLYPFIMKTYAMPVGYPKYRNEEFFKNITFNSEHKFFGYLDVLVSTTKTTEDFLPVLPYRLKKDQDKMGIIYPEGVFRGTYFSEELKLALKYDYKIIKIFSGYEYIESHIIFDRYVNDIYDKRLKASNKILNDFYKKMLNTLYGRFGLVFNKTQYNQTNSVEDEYIDHNTNEYISHTAKTVYNNIAVTSAITSYARIYMYEMIKKYNMELIYIDTDGIFVKNPLPESILTTTKELGKFRLESQNEAAFFMSNKFYFYKAIHKDKYETKFKGISSEYKIKDINEIIETHKEILKRTINVKKVINSIRIKKEEKERKYTFKSSRKRRLVKENKTKPWIIKERI